MEKEPILQSGSMEIQQEVLRPEGKKFNFENDFSDFVNNEYPKHLKILHERASPSKDLCRAVTESDLATLQKIKTVLSARINYLDEKSKDSEEDMEHVEKLKLLLQEINNRLGED